VHWASGVASLIYDIPIFRVPLFLKKIVCCLGKKQAFAESCSLIVWQYTHASACLCPEKL
jgi:hypothetical protein